MALALAAGLFAGVNLGAAQPASALQQCPIPGQQPPVAGIEYWIEQYYDRGVTVCWGMDTASGLPELAAVMQIVDLADGARVLLRADPECPCGIGSADQTFRKHTAEEWWNTWGYFSATNASFFTDATNPTTKLSLPEVTSGKIHSYGTALNGGPDATFPKVSLRIGGLDQAFQSVRLTNVPAAYTTANIDSHFGCGNTSGTNCSTIFGLVGFAPDANVTGPGPKRRTMLGTNAGSGVQASRVYILATVQSYELSEARAIMDYFGSQMEMQLDGGGSTQSISNYHQIDSYIFRPVPNALFVSSGP
ncbi:hypothetical protein C1I92_07225 [Jiangella anatolica]|uniref:Phosphodiester glycosidase domain-containing protein n=2 Tax=Jiangella anatolica TaxID=2670374 RepID=A0A2W2CGY0_9ACTN|nr:hypothetical protein C1I92_07225 [Jiangella anatolica]